MAVAAPSLSTSPQTLLSREAELRVRFDPRSSFARVVDIVASIFRQIWYVIVTWSYHLFGPEQQFCGMQITWNADSKALVVGAYGTKSRPSAFLEQHSLLAAHPNIDVFIPRVPHGGACSLEDAAQPILDHVLDYILYHPSNPVCFIGASNGGRLNMWMETELRVRHPGTPVMVSNIAGAHLGTSRMNLLRSLGIADWWFPSVFVDELSLNSEKAQWLLRRVRQALPEGCAPRKYDFAATVDDLIVPNLESSIPDIGDHLQVANPIVVSGHSHDSLIAAVAEQQVRRVVAWIQEFQS